MVNYTRVKKTKVEEKNMKVTKVEVKTFYDVTFTLKDLEEIIKYAKTDKKNIDNVFKNILTADQYFEPFTMEVKEIRYIAQYFGFDGWHNIGLPDKTNKTYSFEAYKWGDTLN